MKAFLKATGLGTREPGEPLYVCFREGVDSIHVTQPLGSSGALACRVAGRAR